MYIYIYIYIYIYMRMSLCTYYIYIRFTKPRLTLKIFKAEPARTAQYCCFGVTDYMQSKTFQE